MAKQDGRNWGLALQRVGAGFQGNLAEFDRNRAMQEELTIEREEKRQAKAQGLTLQRQKAAAIDALRIKSFADAGRYDLAAQAFQSRLSFIEQLGGDPSDTLAAYEKLKRGDIQGLQQDLDVVLNDARIQKLLEPDTTAQPASTFGKQAQDEGLKPGTLAFAARVQELARPQASQPRMVEQGGIQYWAEGPNAGRPVVPGAQGTQRSPVEQFTKQFGALPAGMTPEIINGSLTGRAVPLPGGEKDPAIIEAQKAEKLKAELPTARSKFVSITQPLQSMLSQIKEIKKDPNTRDVVGAWEGGTNEEKWRINPFTAGGNATAASRIENLRNVAQSIGLNLTRQGGVAPGSITEREWPKFESFIANLDTRQGEKSFFKQLDQAEMMASNLIEDMKKEFETIYGESPLRRREDSAGTTNVDALLDKYAPRN